MGQTAAIILASLVLLSQYSLYGALDAGFRKDFADWDNDIVVVVTWYNKDITWLQVFPEPITVRRFSVRPFSFLHSILKLCQSHSGP